jgi:hypothetical protein
MVVGGVMSDGEFVNNGVHTMRGTQYCSNTGSIDAVLQRDGLFRANSLMYQYPSLAWACRIYVLRESR